MSEGIRLRRLILRGINRDYGPELLRDGRPAGLGIIAGEISTGKTTVLDFIDYCLGASRHPEHPELVEVSIRTVLLEVELNGETCVIERACFPPASTVTLHWTSIEGLPSDHAREVRQVRPAGDPESLSSFLLGVLGLSGIRLKEAPTQASSGVDPLSFRDLLDVAFLDNDRLGSNALLFENDRMKRIKFQQVIDVVFGVHEDAAAELSAAIADAENRREQVSHDIAVLSRFLVARSIAASDVIGARLTAIELEAAEVRDTRSAIDQDLRSRTEVANDLRSRYEVAVAARRAADTRVRDRETLRERLTVLNGQYAADISRLEFSLEAGLLFDDLQIRVCPACRSALESEPTIVDGVCSLCGSTIEHDMANLDVQRELNSTRRRLDELRAYIATVADEIKDAREARDGALQGEAAARTALDTATASAVAPFVAQRDALNVRAHQLAEERAALLSAQNLRTGIGEKDAEHSRLTHEIDDMRQRLSQIEEHRQSRQELVGDLSERFGSILTSFGLHKVESPGLDGHYVPYNRGMHYSRLSSGTKTLVSIAWALAILELAVERGHPHPGFLVIDGVAKNLTPADTAADPDLEPAIIERVYVHIQRWLAGPGRDAQVVFVDNWPPRLAESSILVRYTSDPDRAPFGLIEDAIR